MSCLRMFGALAVAVLLAVPAASAQEPVPQAELMMVKNGVFSMKEGQSMDLTDRAILLHLERVNVRSDGSIEGISLSVNGSLGAWRVGTRYDLKHAERTRDFVKDLRICFIDLVNAVAPQGAPPSATFRLMCE